MESKVVEVQVSHAVLLKNSILVSMAFHFPHPFKYFPVDFHNAAHETYRATPQSIADLVVNCFYHSIFLRLHEGRLCPCPSDRHTSHNYRADY